MKYQVTQTEIIECDLPAEEFTKQLLQAGEECIGPIHELPDGSDYVIHEVKDLTVSLLEN